MTRGADELVFAPLGGLGEIGMNAALYGFGPAARRKWIMVDLGLAFAGPELPGVDLIMPDLAFIEKARKDLLGLVITHAHEDHIGAIADLWPRLGCRVYATPFAAGLLEAKRLSEPGAPDVPIVVTMPGAPIELGPFSVEFIRVAHSIPESCALAIRTPLGTILHSGDWKIDPTPVVGWTTDEARLKEIGDEGVLALISDSTNIMRSGVSPSEADVAVTLRELVNSAPGRVVVTTFASNVARLRSVAEAAVAAGRSVVVVGRAMERVIQIARECGYLEGLPEFLSTESYAHLPRDRVVVLGTGSQGEERAAMARMARGEHPAVKLAAGDRVIFSSRTIPGNEKPVADVINGLVDQSVDVITDRTHMIHVSGHPRRSEVDQLYDWIRPQIAIPAHGEPLHLAEHMHFAREKNVPHVLRVRNGNVVVLAPGTPSFAEDIAHGKLYKDGNLLLPSTDIAVDSRVRLSHGGVISIGIAITRKGELAGDPDMVFAGVPARAIDGRAMDDIIDRAIFETLDSLPRARRRDADVVGDAVEKAVRNAVRVAWGKRPQVHVLVMEVQGEK